MMYPFAILPDSILFLLDDLLTANPHYVSVLLASATQKEIPTATNNQRDLDEKQKGLVWPNSTSEPWRLTSCRVYDGSALSYLMRVVFPKAIQLASPNCSATMEWKEGTRTIPATSSPAGDAGELEALTGVAVVGGLKPTFDTLMHLATKLVKTSCNGNPSKTSTQEKFFLS